MLTSASQAAWPANWIARVRQRAFRTSPADRDPVILRHSRIYILPTRRGFMLVLTLGVMLIASLNYSLSLGLGVTFFVSGLVAAALLHTFRNLAGIKVRPLAAGDTFAGERLAFSVELMGGASARSEIKLQARGTHVLSDVRAGAALTLTLLAPTAKRGRIPLGRLTLSSDFPLGLWRGWAYVHFPLEGIAYPKPEASAPPLPQGPGGPDAFATGRGGDADLAGIREYQRGDPPQRVAWKAVARGAGWFTKAFDGTGGGGPVTLDYAALPRELSAEAKLSRLTAWVLAAERAARPFELRLPGAALALGQGREHRRLALSTLALFPADRT
ncbi:MAG: DUF58 domain-containing protein [Betaproteobacteria bacterium]|nr:MAG: DUF58 domain-containing protein [Betaproteobacteria bacterium]TMH68705.1 MAG: DUF58 domain-containing protein [Betaproteobacteria bacterium]